MRALGSSLALTVLLAQGAAAGTTMLYATSQGPPGIDGFCLSANGALPGTPTVHVDTHGDQPRRLVVANGVLYVAEVDRVEAYSVGARGGLTRIGTTRIRKGMGPRDLAVSADGTLLYVPDRSLPSVVAYPLPLGAPPDGSEFTSCIEGRLEAGYQHIEVDGTLLYVSSTTEGTTGGRMEIYRINADGGLPKPRVDENYDCRLATDDPPDPALVAERKQLRRPKAFVIVNGILYVEELNRKRISAFQLVDGLFSPPTYADRKNQKPRPDSTTNLQVTYQGLVHHLSTLLGTQFPRGRVDAYRLGDDGRLPKQPTAMTSSTSPPATSTASAPTACTRRPACSPPPPPAAKPTHARGPFPTTSHSLCCRRRATRRFFPVRLRTAARIP
jgi:hypothetical protein